MKKKCTMEIDKALEFTEADTWGCKLYHLIINGGGLVLRRKLEKKFATENKSINDREIKVELRKLERRGILKSSQYEKVYPRSGISSSEDYDVTVLVALFRTLFCDPDYSGWYEGNEPNVNDHSDEAEIVRIRDMRNAVLHRAETGIDESQFRKFWHEITEVLVRFGEQDIPDLRSKLDKLKSETIDKTYKKVLQEKIKQWVELDKSMESFVVKTILDHSLKANVLERSRKEVSDVLDDEYFVETSLFSKAKHMLEADGVIVIKGAQGEGKTTIAKKLVNNPAKCLKINSVADWDMYSKKDVETVLVDDMFGCTMFDKNESRKWLKIFPQLMSKVSNKELKLIITSRSYILDDAQNKLFISYHIRECNMIEISSKKLTDKEKREIIEKHLKKNDREIDEILITECVKQSNKPSSCIIGFPECARLFCVQESLFQKKDAFFETPMTHIKECLKSVFESDGAFLAFFVLWAQPSQKLYLFDLERSPTNIQDYIKRPIEHQDYKIYGSLRIIRDILSNNSDFIHYDTKTETFRFQHQVLGDAVGLVAFEKNKTAVLEYCDASFIERYVCIEGQAIDNNRLDIVLNVIPQRFDQLCSKMGHKMIGNKEQYLNCSLLLHPAFKDKHFCAKFIEVMKEQEMLDELLTRPFGTVVTSLLDVQSLIDKTIMNTEVGILMYALRNSLMTLACACFPVMIRDDKYAERLKSDLNMSILLTVLEGDKYKLKGLLNEMKVQDVESYIILSAIRKADVDMLDLLLDIRKMSIDEYRRNGKSPLTIFVEENDEKAVKCILESKYFEREKLVDYQNEIDKKTALHIACTKGYIEIIRILLKQKPNLQQRDSCNECPIHSAALNGKTEVVEMLLIHDIKQGDYTLDVSDNKGMSLYHLAVRNQDESLFELLLKHKIPVTGLNSRNQTPLVFAVQNLKLTVIQKLTKVSIEQNAHTIADSDGQTALHLVTERLLTLQEDDKRIDALNVTLEMLSKDGNCNIQNKNGKTPLQIVQHKRKYIQKKLDMHDGVIKRLKKYE